MKKILSLDIKYSSIQMIYYAAWAAMMGYASVYLLDKGFSNSIIGTTLSIICLLGVILQPMAGTFADKHKHIELRKMIAIIMILAIICSLSLYLLKESSLLLLILFIGVLSFNYAIVPLLNSMAFVFEKYNIKINFGLARGCGSGAYAISSILLGYLIEDVGASVLPLIYMIFNIMLIVVTYSFVVPRKERNKIIIEAEEESHGELTLKEFTMKYKRFVIFIIGTVFVYFSMSFLNNFFIQVITPIGGSESDMGIAVFIAAMLELPTMALFNTLQAKFGCNMLIRISTFAFIIKAIVTMLAPNMMWIYFAQIFQIPSFAFLTPASIYYANIIVNEADLTKGQSLITMGSTGTGILASLIGGILLDITSVRNVLLICIIVSSIGAIIVNMVLENP